MSEYILEMHDIVKYFPGVQALKGVDLKVESGKVHALMGENGAGKSTLMNCLIGIIQKTSGTILYKGEETNFPDTNTALNSGISMIHQELSPIPERTVMQNVWVGREPKNGLFIDKKKMRKDTLELFERLNVTGISPETPMKKLSVSQMQLIEIAKAVSYDSSIVIMDEPTSTLTQTEATHLFEIIEQLKANDVAIIYITHKMDEVFQICDDVTVLRDGEYIITDKVENMTTDKLITHMVGREVTDMFPKIDCPIGETILKVENLSSDVFKDVSFELRKGEILGFAGLVGAGRTEVVETIFGIRAKTGGKIYKDGKEITVNSPIDAIENKMAMLTEDRRESGIVGVLPVGDNITLANLKSYGNFQNQKQMKQDTYEYIDKLKVRTPSAEFLAENLSGGNQQKLLVARWLLTDPDILFVDEPTRGIDVGAKAEIHTLITNLAAEGKAVIMISSEMPEVLGMSDRVLVMHEGRMTGIIDRKDATQELVMRYATGEIE